MVMKIAYVSTYDSLKVKNWSGLGYYISKTLERQCEKIYFIGPLKEKFGVLFKAKTIIHKLIFNKNYLRHREPFILKSYARQVSKALSSLDIDLVFSPGILPIVYLETRKPIVFWSDATFMSMLDFYPSFTNICGRSIKNGYLTEKFALEKCALAIYASEWAANSAIEYYGINKSKVKVVPFGANIDYYPTKKEVGNIINSRSQNKCKLLFIGIEWKRKGGEIAYRVVKKLNAKGIKAELRVVGCVPNLRNKDKDFIRCYGFLRKSNKEELAKLNRLISESHFLILPTQAEAYGLVLCEANAFGVPCIATDVGGIPTIIKNDLNGRIFVKDSKVDDYCEYIKSLIADYQRYKKMALSSYDEYTSRLNWQVAGKSVRELLNDIK